jgi:hypothetical protein
VIFGFETRTEGAHLIASVAGDPANSAPQIFVGNMGFKASDCRENSLAKIQLGVRVEEALKAAVETVAKEERRPISAQVEIIFEEWLKARKKKKAK